MSEEVLQYHKEFFQSPANDPVWGEMQKELMGLGFHSDDLVHLHPFFVNAIPRSAVGLRVLVAEHCGIQAPGFVDRETGDIHVDVFVMHPSGAVENLKVEANVTSGLRSASLRTAAGVTREDVIHVITDSRKHQISVGNGLLTRPNTKIVALFGQNGALLRHETSGPRIVQLVRYRCGVESPKEIRDTLMRSLPVGFSLPDYGTGRVQVHPSIVFEHDTPIFLWVTPRIGDRYEPLYHFSEESDVCLARDRGNGQREVVVVKRTREGTGIDMAVLRGGKLEQGYTRYKPGELPHVVHRGNSLTIDPNETSRGIPVVLEDCVVRAGGHTLSAMMLHDEALTAEFDSYRDHKK